jgi:hypothetical protein
MKKVMVIDAFGAVHWIDADYFVAKEGDLQVFKKGWDDSKQTEMIAAFRDWKGIIVTGN